MSLLKHLWPHKAAQRNVVYSWPTVKGYYAEKSVAGRVDLRAKLGENASDVLRRLPSNTQSFLFHIDLTDTSNCPLDRNRLVEELQSRGIRVWNAKVTNIAKRTVHALTERLGLPRTLAPRDGDGKELLIVKTNRNYGGRSERWLRPREREQLGISEGTKAICSTLDYKVLPRADVPPDWWDDAGLVVERFISSPDKRLIRVYLILNHVVFWSGYSEAAVKKIAICTDIREVFLRRGEFHPELPPALLRTVYDVAEAIPLDFGSIDLLGDGAGRYYMIDINYTPWLTLKSKEQLAFLSAAWEQSD